MEKSEIVTGSLAAAPPDSINLRRELTETHAQDVLEELEHELVGLAPVKARIKQIVALLAVARPIRNGLDKARLHHVNRHFEQAGSVSRDDLMTIDAPDVLTSRVFDLDQANEGPNK